MLFVNTARRPSLITIPNAIMEAWENALRQIMKETGGSCRKTSEECR